MESKLRGGGEGSRLSSFPPIKHREIPRIVLRKEEDNYIDTEQVECEHGDTPQMPSFQSRNSLSYGHYGGKRAV